MKKLTLSAILGIAAVILLVISFFLKGIPGWVLTIVALVLAVAALIATKRGWKEKK